MARPAEVATESAATAVQEPPTPHALRSVAAPAEWIDERTGAAKLTRSLVRKAFPDHWSFLLGEIALYSFIVLLLTGVFLTIWFQPSMGETEYEGSYELLKGVPMSQAFASTLHLTFDVRGGLLVRQIHHWAAILFVAAATVHMLRIFFTGAFRKPREINWLIGIGLFSMALIEGFAGYSLPDDLLSGTGLRFVDGLVRSIPLVGTWLEFFVFGGEFPGTAIIPRLYMVHILLVPALLLGLVSAHLALIVHHKHTQYPGPGRTERNVVGYPVLPIYAAKAGGFFFVVFGVLILMGGLMQINPIWKFGPYTPNQVTAGSQPDWYMGWVEGAVRIMPNWEWHIGHTTWSWNVFLPAVVLMGLLFTGLALWPFIESWLTGDKHEHHVLDRPRNQPTRTALGVAGMTCYAMFWLAGGNDIIATHFQLSLNSITRFMRVAVFVAPFIAYHITKRTCISLQRRDRDRVLHGSETGVIVRSPDGGYSEAHAPITPQDAFTLTQHPELDILEASPGFDANGRPDPALKVSRRRAALSRWFLADSIAKPSAGQIEAAHSHHDDHGAEAASQEGVESAPEDHAIDEAKV